MKSDKNMEYGISPQHPELEKIKQIIRGHFQNLRQKQTQNRELTTMGDDIKFLVKFINDSIYFPIPVLRAVGVIILKNTIGFHQAVFPEFIKNSRFKNKLMAEGWREIQGQQLDSLIGAQNAKNYSLFEIPEISELYRYTLENPRVVATQETVNMPFKENSSHTNNSKISCLDTPFPLVSIQYEREQTSYNIFEYLPSKSWKPPQLKNCKIVEVINTELRPPQ